MAKRRNIRYIFKSWVFKDVKYDNPIQSPQCKNDDIKSSFSLGEIPENLCFVFLSSVQLS